MSTASNGSGGSEQTPGGTSETTQTTTTESTEATEAKASHVSRDTYVKAVDEAKKAKAKLAEIERKEKEREEAALKEQGNFKTLLEQREAELKETREKLAGREKSISDSRKMSAFLGAVTGEVPKQYWGLIDLDAIPFDPETGKPDQASIAKAAKEFEKQFPDVVKRDVGGKLPNEAARGTNHAVSFVAEIRAAKTQAEYDRVMAKYERA